MNKKIVCTIIDCLIIAIVSIILFLIGPVYSPSFLPAYIFIVVSLLGQLTPVFLENINETAYAISFYTIGAIYLLAQIIVSLLGITIFILKPLTVVSLSVVILLMYSIVVIIIANLSLSPDKKK